MMLSQDFLLKEQVPSWPLSIKSHIRTQWSSILCILFLPWVLLQKDNLHQVWDKEWLVRRNLVNYSHHLSWLGIGRFPPSLRKSIKSKNLLNSAWLSISSRSSATFISPLLWMILYKLGILILLEAPSL